MLNLALSLVKDSLGLRSTVRDTYLSAIIDSVITEMKDEKGLVLVETNPHHLMFVVDLASWRYRNLDSDKGMPRNLKLRLNNLVISSGGTSL